MSKTLKEIAQDLKDSPKKVQLIYAFNGTGKTRLSKEFKKFIAPKNDSAEDDAEATRTKILYYNAFTEDLFYWDNDLDLDSFPTLKIQPNNFTQWVLKDQGQDQNIITHFQHYTSGKITPQFHEQNIILGNGQQSPETRFSKVTFSLHDNQSTDQIKISKGEESNFIWSIFYILIEEVISELNKPESEYDDTNPFHNLEYIFIDDPVSSLDENHLIQLAVNLAQLIKSSDFENNNLKFIISTHNPLFYNVLSNELKLTKNGGFMLSKNEDDTFEISAEKGASNKRFSYHLHLIEIIKDAINSNNIEKFHFMLLRNLYEKTASFLGYQEWSNLLPEEAKESYKRHIDHFSHKKLSNEEVSEPTEAEKQIVNFLLNHLISEYNFREEVEDNG